ncbi:MAG: hypothetical protein C4525_06495 [Desulfarculus sp.]|nr:MAG: hypothetical protein C4525_06495 [Desulfarculus sp.]
MGALRRGWGYWLPRVLVLIFAASVYLPLPRFLEGLTRDELVLWLARLLWVLGLPLALAAAAWLLWQVRRRRGR